MTPLIYTINGNVPIDSLNYHTEWVDTPMFTKFREWYTDNDGVTVKESAHVMAKEGVLAQGQIEILG